MKVESPRYQNKLFDEFFAAAKAAGLSPNPDFNDWDTAQVCSYPGRCRHGVCGIGAVCWPHRFWPSRVSGAVRLANAGQPDWLLVRPGPGRTYPVGQPALITCGGRLVGAVRYGVEAVGLNQAAHCQVRASSSWCSASLLLSLQQHQVVVSQASMSC